EGRGREDHNNRHRATAWQPVPELADLAEGEVGGFRVTGLTALACRVGGDVGRRATARRGAAVSDVRRGFRRRSRRCRCRRRQPSGADTGAGSRRRAFDGRSRRGGVMEGTGNVIDVLARIRASRGAPQPAGERCEMCSEAIADEHQHVVNLEGRQLMCVCRGCYLLSTDTEAELRYRAIPDRYLAFPDFALDRRAWETLQIPVGLAFFFH